MIASREAPEGAIVTQKSSQSGRERTYFEPYWNDFAADKTHSIPEAQRQAYTAAYARPGRMRAGWAISSPFRKRPRILLSSRRKS